MTTQSLSAARADSAGPGTMNTMKAIRIHRRGGPETLVYEDAPIPALRPGDALVRVHAAGISPAEFTWHIYETPDGRSRLPKIPSHEVSGVVAAVAPDVRDVEVGDAVYGLTDFFRDGGAAEYVAVRAADLAPKPRSLDHASAATVPLSALTAWQALFDHAAARARATGADPRRRGRGRQLRRPTRPLARGPRHRDGLRPQRRLRARARRGRGHRLWRNAVRDRRARRRRGPRHRRRHDHGAVLVRPAAQRAARHHRQAARRSGRPVARRGDCSSSWNRAAHN